MCEFKTGDIVIVRQFAGEATIPDWALEYSYGRIKCIQYGCALVEIADCDFSIPLQNLEPMFRIGEEVVVVGDETRLDVLWPPVELISLSGVVLELDCDDSLSCRCQFPCPDGSCESLWLSVDVLSRVSDAFLQFSPDDFEALLGG